MRTPYDRAAYPPVPRVDVRLASPGGAFRLEPLRALVDTGADATLVPIRYIEALDVDIRRKAFVRSAWGERRRVSVHRVDVGIGSLRIPGLEVLADDRNDDMILGRNLLNKLLIVLDGPHGMLEIRE